MYFAKVIHKSGQIYQIQADNFLDFVHLCTHVSCLSSVDCVIPCPRDDLDFSDSDSSDLKGDDNV